MTNYNIKEMVSDSKKVSFLFYRLNELWYETETGFKFPVPISDTGDGVFNYEEKAILLMRYIRKHVKFLEDAEKEAQAKTIDCELTECNCGGVACEDVPPTQG